MKSILRSLAVCAAVLFATAIATPALAADYTYNVPLGTALNEAVLNNFSDNISFTPTVSGNYNVDIFANNANGGCSTRYCHSKWTISISFTVASVGAVSLLPNGNATMFMQAGTTYVLNVQGTGTGTGTHAGQGAYGVSIASQ